MRAQSLPFRALGQSGIEGTKVFFTVLWFRGLVLQLRRKPPAACCPQTRDRIFRLGRGVGPWVQGLGL